jgi:hypothetical protein
MGINNSSKTRVQPIFDQLYAKDKSGMSWLPRLLQLPEAGASIDLSQVVDYEIVSSGWESQVAGKREFSLDSPVSLLSWLIRHPRQPTSGTLSDDPEKKKKRQEWIACSPARLMEALRLLRNNPQGEDWFIFEGPSQPDVYIETKNLIVVIEGKRTEPKPTTSTKWMPGRHQMLRHLDCAWEVKGRKQIIGFFIVEGFGDTVDVPANWITFSHQTISSQAVSTSLPHRGPEEQAAIARGFKGITTWQRVCSEFNIEWGKMP